jgi:hypothetical protein
MADNEPVMWHISLRIPVHVGPATKHRSTKRGIDPVAGKIAFRYICFSTSAIFIGSMCVRRGAKRCDS